MPPRRSGRMPKQTDKVAGNSEGVKNSQQKRGRKRAASVNSDESRKILKKTVNGREIDTFCWICHKNGQDMICNSCPRVFHSDCLKKSRCKVNPSGTCFECQVTSVSGNNDVPKINKSLLNHLLLISMQEALKEDGKKSSKLQQTPENSKFCRYFKTWPQGTDNGCLCYLVDFDIIIDKINNDPPYASIAEFFGDIKWLYHNCYILYGPDTERTDTAHKLLKNFKQELLDMEACPECYKNKHSDEYLLDDFFTKVCEEPHDIVWAKLRGSPYWPAKVLQIYNGHADIRFFGTHDKSVIPLNQCFRISEESPFGKVVKRPNYKDAVSELNIYVQNYERRFGSFYFYPKKTPLEKTKKKDNGKRGRQRMNVGYTCSVTHDAEGNPAPEITTGNQINSTISNSYSDVITSNNNGENGIATAVTKPHEESVSVCMTFTEDIENPTENNRTEIINKSSVCNFPHAVTTPISGSSDYISNESGFEDLHCVNSVTDNNRNFINSDGNIGPCIESVTNGVNYSFSSLENRPTSGQGTLNNVDQVTVNNSTEPARNYSDEVVDDDSNEATSNIGIPTEKTENASVQNNTYRRLAESLCSSGATDEETQTLTILLEKIANDNIVSRLMNNKNLTEALMDRLLHNHPEWKRPFSEINIFTKGLFFKMWLAIEQLKIEEEPLKVFSAIYNEERSMREDLEQENRLLKEQLIEMKKKSEVLNEIAERKRAEREENRNIIIQALCKNVNVNCKKFQSKISNNMRNSSSSQSQDEKLNNELIHADCAVEEKKAENKHFFQLNDDHPSDTFTDITKKESTSHEQQKQELNQQWKQHAETQTTWPVSHDKVKCSLKEEVKEESSKIPDNKKLISCNKENDQIATEINRESQKETIQSSSEVDYYEEVYEKTVETIMPFPFANTSSIPSTPSYAPPDSSYSIMVSSSVEMTSTVITSQINGVEREIVEDEEE